MSYKVSPQVTRAAPPGVNDDSTKGFVIGSAWVDTAPAPDVLYVCTNAAAGAATWVQVSTITAHTQLSTLDWPSSKHTGATNSVACFSGAGAALTAQATVDGTVLGFSGGVLQFIAIAAAVAFTDPRAIDVELLPFGATVVDAVSAQVLTGVIA